MNTDNTITDEKSWYHLNRLVRTTEGTDVMEYYYDNAGNRFIKKETAGGITESFTLYLRHGQIAVAMDIEIPENDIEIDGKLNRYVLSGDLLAGRITKTYYADTTVTEAKSYYHLDHLNSTKCTTDDAGAVEVMYEYRAFGEQLKRLDGIGDETGDMAKYSYGGKELDDRTNLYYFNARYYDATIGRFINVDPVQDGSNWYIYCSNNPIRLIDPTGLDDRDPYWAGLAYARLKGDAYILQIFPNETTGYIYTLRSNQKDNDLPDSIQLDIDGVTYDFRIRGVYRGKSLQSLIRCPTYLYIPESGSATIDYCGMTELYQMKIETPVIIDLSYTMTKVDYMMSLNFIDKKMTREERHQYANQALSFVIDIASILTVGVLDDLLEWGAVAVDIIGLLPSSKYSSQQAVRDFKNIFDERWLENLRETVSNLKAFKQALDTNFGKDKNDTP